MAWNEPGGGKDPWGSGSGKGGNPPDLDAALKDIGDKFGKIFGGGSGGGGGIGGVAIIGLLAIVLVVWALLGFYQVDAKEKALVLRLGKFHEIIGDGLHWNPPLVDIVTRVRVTEERQYQTRGQMLTEDENIVELPLTVHYNIKSVKDFVLNVKAPEHSLRHATDSALRHVVGSSGLDEVVSTGREQLSIDVKERLQTYLDSYGTGIKVVKVNILEAKPPSAVKAAYDDVIKAREDRERVINEAQAYANGIVPEARGRAKRVLEEAKGYQARVVADAEGETERFDKLLHEYQKAPVVTRQRLYLDTMQSVMENSSKILVDVEGGNNMLYLPLDKIMQQQTSSVSGSSQMKSLTSADVNLITEAVIERIRNQSSNSQRRESR
ncbi:MAG: FtsH protease activity modulator HflK [Gammaproteobacteria bacterium]|nr:FtsH protease activity modulator HflK [Gammaproteobacteria bacterium]MBQ0839391.1 FtsH protease activity modulator HflK [Gammaproteobacteria bacterium]